jgi:putative MFS transporter
MQTTTSEHGETVEPLERDKTRITIDEALHEHVKFGAFQILLLQVCGASWLFSGIQMSVMMFIGPYLREEWNLRPFQTGLLSVIVPLGAIHGAIFCGMMSDRWGRRLTVLYVVLWSCLFGVLSSLATGYWTLLPLQFCVGFGAGGIMPTDCSILMEYVTKEQRGSFVNLINVYYIFGAMIECILSWILLDYANWRLLMLLSSIPGIILCIFRLSVSESARFLITNRRYREALESLKKAALLNGVAPNQSPLFHDNVVIVPNSERDVGYSLHSNIFKELKMILSIRLRLTSMLLFIIWFLFGLGGGGFMYMAPPLFHVSEAHMIYLFPLMTYTITIFGYLVSSLVIDQMRRKTLAIMSLLASGLSVMLISFVAKYPIILLIQCMFANLIMSFAWSAMNIYTSESYPTRCRATGIGACNAFTRIGAVVSPIILHILLPEFGLYIPYLIFGSALIIGSICVIFLPFETLDSDLEDDLYAYNMGAGGDTKLVYKPISSEESQHEMPSVDDFML